MSERGLRGKEKDTRSNRWGGSATMEREYQRWRGYSKKKKQLIFILFPSRDRGSWPSTFLDRILYGTQLTLSSIIRRIYVRQDTPLRPENELFINGFICYRHRIALPRFLGILLFTPYRPLISSQISSIRQRKQSVIFRFPLLSKRKEIVFHFYGLSLDF